MKERENFLKIASMNRQITGLFHLRNNFIKYDLGRR